MRHALRWCTTLLALVAAEPPCYATREARVAPVRGAWVARGERQSSYRNLSCPLEWSKYSCVHQGQAARAAAAAGRGFAPAGCALGGAWRPRGNGTRVFFWGDSLLRQVFIAMACGLHAAGRVVDAAADWPPCGAAEWPCHGAARCVRCGPGSGFFGATVTLATGAELRTVSTDAPGGAVAFFHDVRPDRDVVVVEAGVHGSSPFANAQRVLAAARPLFARSVRVIWVVTPQDAFPSRSGDGRFEPKYLRSHRGGCVKSVAPARSSGEWRALRGDARALDALWGVIDLAGLEDQGDAKVGAGLAGGDCQHYCMPGPPDVLAAALDAMLAALPA